MSSQGYIGKQEAKESAHITLINLKAARLAYSNESGKKYGLVLNAAELESSERGQSEDLFRAREEEILRYIAELQVDVLQRLENPGDPEFKFIRDEVQSAEHNFGSQRVTKAVQKLKYQRAKEGQVSAPIENWKPKAPTGPLVLRLYKASEDFEPSRGTFLSYEETGKEYKIDDLTVLASIPRPATVAVTMREDEQRPKLDAEKTLEINPKHRDKRTLRNVIEQLNDMTNPEMRKDQFTLQNIIRQNLLA